MNSFIVIIPLKKSGDNMMTGIASATSLDRDMERMSLNALNMMAADIRKNGGVNLFGNHKWDWENVLGGVTDAQVIDEKLSVNVSLDESDPKVAMLKAKLRVPGVKIGLSVGGSVTGVRWEYSKDAGKKIKVLDEVKIHEISVVGIPSNADSYLTIPQAIAKSAGSSFDVLCDVCHSTVTEGVCELCLTEY